MQITMNVIMFGLIVVFLSSIIQGITGFGFALLAVPLLTIFIFPGQSLPLLTSGQATPILVIFGLLTNLFIILKSHKHIKLIEIWLIILFGIIGIPIGVFMLKVVDPNVLKVIAGFIIIIAAMILIRGYAIKMKSYSLSSMLAGFLSGLLNGSLSMSGPPIVLFLSNQDVGKEYFRANITIYAIITNIITIITLAFSGLINTQVLTYAGILTPALVIGVLIGIIVSAKVNEKLFKRLTLLLLIAMGVLAVALTIKKMTDI